MRSKKRLAVMAVITVIVLLVAVPAVYGVQPDNAGVLYSTYLDWLQGKPVGLAQVNPIIPHSIEKATLVVIDYTSGQPKVLYKGSFMNPTVKIKRIPVGTKLKTVTKNGKASQVMVTEYRPVQLLVIVSAKNYWGAKFVEFTPNKPMTPVNARVPLHRDNIGESIKNLGRGFQVTTETAGSAYMDLKIFRLHSVPGVEETLIINSGNTIALDSFSQAVESWEDPSPTGWERSGAVNAVFGYGAPVPTSNGEMKIVYGHVRYRVDKYTVCGYLVCRTFYELKPQEIEYFSKIDTKSDSGTIPSYLPKRYHLRSAGNRFTVYFDKSNDDGGVYFSTSISTCFGEGVTICFTGNVDTYRESSGNRPSVRVTIKDWHGALLYFAKYSSNGNYYEVPLQWG